MGILVRALAALGGALTLAFSGVAEEAARNPVMTAVDYFSPDDEQQQPLRLTVESLELSIQLAAGYAETNAIIAFRNPTDDELEGQFLLEMPDHALVTGYGLDIDGRMVPGVIVEGKKAKKAFEARIRRRVDPGLGEVTRENIFKNRVFPIQPGETRKVSVSFIAPLSAEQPYVLPLEVSDPVRHVSIKIDGAYDHVSLPEGLGDRKFESGAVIAQDIALSGELKITPAATTATGTTQSHPNGETFVALTIPEPETSPVKRSDNVRIYWDVSMSHMSGIEAELHAIEKALEIYAPDRIELVPFANGVAGKRLRANTIFDTVGRLGSLQKNGATNLERLFAQEQGATGADICILVTDGRITLGKLPDQLLPCRLYTLSAGKNADRGALNLLARRGGGRFIDAAQGDGASQWGLEGVKLSAIRADGRSLLSTAEWINDGNVIRILAPVQTGLRSVSVKINGETLRIPLRPIADGTMLGAVWAGHHLSTMRASAASWADRVALAQKYGVAGPEGSFLVLEDIADYVEQRLNLPASGFNEDERATYLTLIAEAQRDDEEARETRLADVAEQWEELLVWYRTDHSKRPRQKDRGPAFAQSGASAPSMEEPMPAAPMMEEDAAYDLAPAESRSAEAVQESIVVTGARREEVPTVKVAIRKWSPDRPYLKAVQGLCAEEFFSEYVKQRNGYSDLPGFYLEMADVAAECDDPYMAAETALSAVELPASTVDTMSAVANRLMEYGAYDAAIDLYRRVASEDGARPQPWRDLALALEIKAMKYGTSRAKRREILGEALDHLAHVIETPWDGDYDGIELISVIEANRIRDRLLIIDGSGSALDRRLRNSMQFDLRIIANWNVDSVDMDLWVDEPTGERTYYGNQNSRIGGRLSNDMTDGYGPEEYLIRKAAPGKYEIRMNYFRSDIVNPNGAVTLRAYIFRNWGSHKQHVEAVDLEFTSDEESEYLVAIVEVEPPIN